jgi:hypothetical protein
LLTAPIVKELSAILQIYKDLNKETDDEKWLRETDAKIIEEVWGKAAEAVEEVKKPMTELQKTMKVIDWRIPEVEKFKEAIKPDAFDPDKPLAEISFDMPGNAFDPVAGIVAEVDANEALSFSIYEVVAARERQLAAEVATEQQMQKNMAVAMELGAAVGEVGAILSDNHQSQADKLKAITKIIVDQFYKQAVAAVIAQSATLGPFGVGAAIAGLTLIKSLFAQLGHSGGASSSGGGGGSNSSASRSLKNPYEDTQHIQLGGFVTLKGEDLIIAFQNAQNKNQGRRG